ncbi:MAG TPA: sensor histidine kinase, partial [Candidatus Pygmaiobacter gallistercoris]|nr:sensor histidine kinase [Candidatus Pygmaiobacter gallistercoris]
MKAGKGGGGLLGLLARYILGLALTLLALAGLALLVWDGEMNRLFYPPDWDGLLADPALAQERYAALAPYLRDTGEIAVYNGDGSLAWASDDDFDPSLTTSELGCIPLQGSSSRIDCYPYLDTAGGNRTLLVRTDFGNAGEQSRAMVLDGSGRVVWGGFGDGRA